MKPTASDKIINKLIDKGWSIDHSALSIGYHYAGTVGTMRPKHNIEYCRVHHGKCVNVKLHGMRFCFQQTTVMRHEITK